MIAAPQQETAELALDLPDEAATRALARTLAAIVEPGDILALEGDLGTGKTVFARAFVNALAMSGAPSSDEEVPSPTFTLVQTYERVPAAVWHFDLYRLEDPQEAYELGIEEAFGEGISLIEWPERLGRLLPARRLLVALSYGKRETARHAVLHAGETWRARLRRLEGEPTLKDDG